MVIIEAEVSEVGSSSQAQSNATRLYVVSSILIPIAIISTGIRIWAELRHHRKRLAPDDFLIVWSTLVSVVYCAVVLQEPRYGLGRPIETVSAEDRKHMLKYGYVATAIYIIATASTKLSVLSLYHRAFPSIKFQRMCLATAVIVIMWLLGSLLLQALICRPIRKLWEPTTPGRCADTMVQNYFYTVSILALDLWIFALPLPLILRMRMITTRKKIGLGCLFSIGLGTCLIVALRVVFIPTDPRMFCQYIPASPWRSTTHLTTLPANATVFVILTTWEPVGGILCANLPLIYKPVADAFRRIMGTSRCSPGDDSPQGGPHSWYQLHRIVKQRARNARLGLSTLSSESYSEHAVYSEPMDLGGALVERRLERTVSTRAKEEQRQAGPDI
ncbi:uncharacterized protein DSM5745_05147 [Aspergillus mulundensis]|uniref:Rhodopsin domain-containing protein n=1 Tax=Aspergillus mulundensis TaxID=1810919 RepID=A0A3D8S5W0_9EURO|nr:hypothetical protein DSM5745_05147 [Aspergillus mulundensis]RDW81590.1 hypothetical protein DSM5745_05147 [Aspergillus mulundensis]